MEPEPAHEDSFASPDDDSGEPTPGPAAVNPDDGVDLQVETELIRSAEIAPATVARVGDSLPRRRWLLALSLLAVVFVQGMTLTVAVCAGRLTAEQAVTLAGVLITPLIALLGTAVAFHYKDAPTPATMEPS